jgi:hydroxymethylbilane synthase
VPFRGNVDTRLEKLARGLADATLLAAAGLSRLGRLDRATALLDPERFPPAPAQGAIALEIRADEARSRDLVLPLDHAETHVAVTAERAFLRELDGSCRTPIGAYSVLAGSRLTLTGEILAPDGSQRFRGEESGSIDEPETIGRRLGRRLINEAGPDFLKLFAA